MQDDAPGGGWSVPGSLVEQPQPAETTGAPPSQSGWATAPGSTPPPAPGQGEIGGAGPLAGAAAEAEVPKLALQPMTVADILDGAFAIVKARPARIFALCAILVVPINLFTVWVSRNTLGDEELWDVFGSEDPAVFADTSGDNGFDGGDMLLTAVLFVLPGLALVFLAACIAHMVAAWTAGKDVAAGELAWTVARRWWALLLSFVVIHVIEVATIFTCWLGLPFVIGFFAVTAPAIGAEGLGPFASMRRAMNLAGRRYWPTLGIALLIGIVSILLGTALGGLLPFLTATFDWDIPWPLLAGANIVSAVVTTPFVAAATVLLYLDLRVRTEGLDIELAAIDLTHNAA